MRDALLTGAACDRSRELVSVRAKVVPGWVARVRVGVGLGLAWG